ncbi:hypothetical protein ACXWOS_11210, partial [Streptococcus pyogenes]
SLAEGAVTIPMPAQSNVIGKTENTDRQRSNHALFPCHGDAKRITASTEKKAATNRCAKNRK